MPFDRNKVRQGVERACWKRPVRESQISELVAELETSLSTLSEFENLPEILTVINKSDKINDISGYPKDAVFISAKEKTGLDELKKIVSTKLAASFTIFNAELKYSELSSFKKIEKFADSAEYVYLDDRITVKVCVKNAFLGKFSGYLK
ncbi:MAG: hypothetical protein J6Z34_00595 [Clostridia bacterium]|nr:hypothetical protein [Clostridia bacterium]